MGLRCYLAMTAAEIAGLRPLPTHLAYMACHFSPYSTGLSNIPGSLPPGSLLTLNDRTPICGHDPRLIAAELTRTVRQLKCSGVVLDFQRPENQETAELCRILIQALPCPPAVSAIYAEEFSCPVLLPPVPPDCLLSEHLAPWEGREIWLEAGLNGLQITLTSEGHAYRPLPSQLPPDSLFSDEALHCHYYMRTEAQSAHFFLLRSPEDLRALLREAEALGVTQAIGLYQELGNRK